MSIQKATDIKKNKDGLMHKIRDLRHDIFYSLLHRETTPLEDLGNRSLGFNWTIRTSGLGKDSIIYCAGVGRDISFEHALADRFGARIILLDPSPTGQETMGLAVNQRPEFEFLPVALGGCPGSLNLAPPTDAEEGSWVLHCNDRAGQDAGTDEISVPCESLSSLMKRLGHNHIDLLKMDIEGAEFEVLTSMIADGVSVGQIAVEFHNSVLAGITRGQTVRMLIKLFGRGYRLIHKEGSNHTLMFNRMLD